LANQHTKGADKALTEQQEKFCEHFLKFGNATAAAEHAGYANPDIQAIRLLSKPHIKQFLTAPCRPAPWASRRS
jgi:phage terminase small subunit